MSDYQKLVDLRERVAELERFESVTNITQTTINFIEGSVAKVKKSLPRRDV